MLETHVSIPTASTPGYTTIIFNGTALTPPYAFITVCPFSYKGS